MRPMAGLREGDGLGVDDVIKNISSLANYLARTRNNDAADQGIWGREAQAEPSQFQRLFCISNVGLGESHSR